MGMAPSAPPGSATVYIGIQSTDKEVCKPKEMLGDSRDAMTMNKSGY